MIVSFEILTRACSSTDAACTSIAKFSASVRFLATMQNRSLGSKVKSGHQTGSHRTEDTKNSDLSIVGPAHDDCIGFAVLNVFAMCGTHFYII